MVTDESMGALKQVPLFPLARKVLFPGIPFHCAVARPLEQDMIFDSIRGRKFLAVLPVRAAAPEHEPDGTVCLARIRRVHSLPSGGLLVDLLGIARATIRAEVPRGKPYRCVQIEVMRSDVMDNIPPEGWLYEACSVIRSLRQSGGDDQDPFPEGLWLDMLCHFLPLPFGAKVQLLREACHTKRCQMLSNYAPYWKEQKLMNRYLPGPFCLN